MLESLDNSDGIQYYGGNDPSKMGGRFKKGGGSATASSARRSAVGQRSSVESKFNQGVAQNIAKQQAVLKNKNSTPEQRAVAQRKIKSNVYASTLTYNSARSEGKDAGEGSSRFGLRSRAQQAREQK
jgi:hypothetical protein